MSERPEPIVTNDPCQLCGSSPTATTTITWCEQPKQFTLCVSCYDKFIDACDVLTKITNL